MIVEAGKTRIGTVRVFSRERDSHTLRLSLSRLLAAADLHPAGLPHTTILCIRRLRDPLPGMLRLQRNSIRPSHAWEQALQAVLQRLMAQAAHPIRGDVAADANAVIFMDHAELLACLAIDWCQGKLATRWWWSHLFQGRDAQSQLIPLWLDQPEYVPAALHHLAVRHEVIPFVRHLSEQTVRTLLDSITYRFALPTLRTAIASFLSTPFQSEYDDGATLQPVPVAPVPTSEHLFSTGQALNSSEHDVSEQRVEPSPVLNAISTTTLPDLLQLAPWHVWIPESATLAGRELTIEQHLLLVIGLMLQRVPTVVRSVSFAFAVQQWCTVATHSTASDAPLHSNASPSSPAHRPEPVETQTNKEDVTDRSKPRNSTFQDAILDREIASETPFSVAKVTEQLSPSPSYLAQPLPDTSYSHNNKQRFEQLDKNALTDASLQATVSTEQPLPFESSMQDETSSEQHETVFHQDKAEPRQEMMHTTSPSELSESVQNSSTQSQEATVDVTEVAETVDMVETVEMTDVADIVDDVQERPAELRPDVYPIEDEYTIETMWGGIFYLVNLSIFLGLYGDFADPLKSGISLTIWDFLALTGNWLLGEQLRADPLWQLLAQLPGRQQDEPPGQHFEPLDDWHVPSEWLGAFPPDERHWEWEVSNGRLRVLHPEGFTVLDVAVVPVMPVVPVESNVSAQLARELVAYEAWQPVIRPASSSLSGKPPMVSTYTEGVAPQVRRWLDWLMPYIYARLQRAFGIEDNPIQLLCQHHARVRVTATHLDVLLSLATLPIEIRRSGLDRNPGWVPAAGRYVTFYFE